MRQKKFNIKIDFEGKHVYKNNIDNLADFDETFNFLKKKFK